MNRRIACWYLAVVVAASLASCGGTTSTATRAVPGEIWVGREEVTGALVGVAIDRDSNAAVAYMSDGKPEGPADELTIHVWFVGGVRDGALLMSAQDGSRLEARLSEDRIVGHVVLDDRRILFFQASPARGEAGFYAEVEFPSEEPPSGPARVVGEDGEERGTAYPVYEECLAASGPPC